MDKKHFIAIAATIQAQRIGAGFYETLAIKRLTEALCDDFAEFNPAFNRQTFLTACGF